jgi:hypothetical protein
MANTDVVLTASHSMLGRLLCDNDGDRLVHQRRSFVPARASTIPFSPPGRRCPQGG